MRLRDEDGTALLQWLSGRGMQIPAIVMTSYAEIRNAVHCMKLGAADYVSKPVNPDELLRKIREATETPVAERTQSPAETPKSRRKTETSAAAELPEYLEGRSDAARRLYEYVRLVAPTNLSVLTTARAARARSISPA